MTATSAAHDASAQTAESAPAEITPAEVEPTQGQDTTEKISPESEKEKWKKTLRLPSDAIVSLNVFGGLSLKQPFAIGIGAEGS